MTKKRTRAAAAPAPAPDEEEMPAGDSPEPDEEEELPWEEELDQWQAGERVEEAELQVVLYRLRQGKGKERVWKWTGEIPDEHEIGLTFGSGTYMVYAVLSAPGGFRKVKHRRFTLAASYDAERARAHREQGLNAPAPAGAFPAGDAFTMMLAMMERVIVPLVNAQRGPAPAAGDLTPWAQAHEMVGRVVEASAQSQLKLSREVSTMIANNGAGAGGEPEADEGDFKDYLKEMIREYGPTLLDAVGLKLKAAAGIVKRDEVYTQLSADPNLFGRVVKLLAKDPEVDPALAEKVLTKLKGIGVAVPLPPGFTFAKPAAAPAPVQLNGTPTPG